MMDFQKFLRAKVFQKVIRDGKNRLLYGPDAPLSDECIFVNPNAVTHQYASQGNGGAPKFRRAHSGLVLDGDWDTSVSRIRGSVKESACIRHFRDGVPWEETGVYEFLQKDIDQKGSADGMRTLDEIRQRYRALDSLYEDIRRDGRMRPRQELPNPFRREHGGIFIHITRDGTPIKAGGGTHRLMLARLLELEVVPAQLGVIHLDAVRAGRMQALRHEGR